MNTFADELVALNSQQEELKAQLKAKTDALNSKMAEAKAKNTDLRKRIKIAVPQQEWATFGITAKQ